MGNIREHGSDTPTKQRPCPRGIINGIGEQGISGFADLGHKGRVQAVVIGMDRRATEPFGANTPIARHSTEQ
jgi:hypothetical protein